MKRCKKCLRNQPFDQFRVAVTRKPYGEYRYRRNRCLACERAAQKARYRANPEKARAYSRKWARENYERRKEYQARYRAENHEKYLKRYRDRYWADPEAHHEYGRRRRMKNRGIEPGDYKRAEIVARDSSQCYLCKRVLEPKDITLDHVIPLARGGKDSRENVKVCCWGCNFAKRAGRA